MSLENAQAWAMRRAFWVHQRLWWTRAMTLGVRALVLDGRRVFLVRHTYRPGWFLPGGGVDPGESAEAAVVRELREEGGILCAERPVLHGFFLNPRGRRRDHIACYVVRRFEASAAHAPDLEIAESGFFALDSLPEGTSAATRARLAEIFDAKPLAETW